MQEIGHAVVEIREIFRRNIIIPNEGGFCGAEDHGENIHKDHATQIEQVEFECADGKFHSPTQPVEEIQKYHYANFFIFLFSPKLSLNGLKRRALETAR